MWATLETYKEIVTNGLDLLSFVLATPEVIRLIHPARKILFKTAAAVAMLVISGSIGFTAAALFLPPFFGALQAIFPPTWWVVIPLMPFAVAVLVAFNFAVAYLSKELYRLVNQSAPALLEWISGNALVIAILIFVSSRCFTIVLAAHQLFYRTK